MNIKRKREHEQCKTRAGTVQTRNANRRKKIRKRKWRTSKIRIKMI